MIIGVDAGALSIADDRLKVGVYRVTYNLLRELGKLDTKNTYRLYSFLPIDRGVMAEFGERMENVVITPATGWFSFRLPLELRLRPVDVFLGLSQAVPASGSHNIGFIYDVGFLYTPTAYGDAANKLKSQTKTLAARSEAIVTISHASKQDILKEYGIPDSRVIVSYPGVDDRFSPEGSMHESENPYIVFVGSLNKAKDIPLALRAFAVFLKKAKKPYDFLLIGGDYWPDPVIDATISDLGIVERVKKLGFVPDEALPAYYRGAKAFFTTALREGFCLPAAEALACGTPVVSVDRGAMKEVVGGGGIVTANADAEEIAVALYNGVSDTRAYRKQAFAQVKKFTWPTFARPVYDLLRSYEHKTQ